MLTTHQLDLLEQDNVGLSLQFAKHQLVCEQATMRGVRPRRAPAPKTAPALARAAVNWQHGAAAGRTTAQARRGAAPEAGGPRNRRRARAARNDVLPRPQESPSSEPPARNIARRRSVATSTRRALRKRKRRARPLQLTGHTHTCYSLLVIRLLSACQGAVLYCQAKS